MIKIEQNIRKRKAKLQRPFRKIQNGRYFTSTEKDPATRFEGINLDLDLKGRDKATTSPCQYPSRSFHKGHQVDPL